MNRNWLAALALPLALSACSTLDSINPFSKSNEPKMASLESFKGTAEARLYWEAEVGKAREATFSPAVVDKTVFAADADGHLARFDDGKQVWRLDVGLGLTGGVGADAKTVVVGTGKGDVLAFSAVDGRALWKARASSEILAAPSVAGGAVYVRSGDSRIFAFDAVSGGQKWVYQRPTPPLTLRSTAGVVYSDPYLFAGFPGGKLVAINAASGMVAWEGTVALPKGTTELDRIADVTSLPVVGARQVCAVAYQGRVACFEIATGNLMWARDISSSAGIAIDSRYVYVADDRGSVHSLDRQTGTSVWKQDKLSLRRLSAPVAMRRYVIVGDLEGYVHVLNRDDGSFVTRMRTDGTPIRAALKGLEDGFLVQSTGGGLWAFDVQ